MASCSTVILWPWCVGIVDGPFQTEARRERTIPVPIARGFSLLLSPSLALAPTIHSYNPHHSFSFSLTLPDSLSHSLLPQTHAYALSFFLFRISMQIRYTFPLTESLLYVSFRNIPIYPFFLRSRTVFRYPRPLFLIPSLSLAHLSTISVHLDIKPQIHPFSSVRVHPHKVLFVLCPRISQSRLLSSFFSFRRLSILLLLCLSLSFSVSLLISGTLVPTTSVNFPTASTDQWYRWPSIRASQSLTSVFYCGFLNHFYACIPSARARTKYCVPRGNNTFCVRPYESHTQKSLVCIFYLYINVCTNRVNDNFLQSGSKNLLNWQFKRYIRFNGFMEAINGNLVYLSWNNWILFTCIVTKLVNFLNMIRSIQINMFEIWKVCWIIVYVFYRNYRYKIFRAQSYSYSSWWYAWHVFLFITLREIDVRDEG